MSTAARFARWCGRAAASKNCRSKRVAGDLRDPASLQRAAAGCGIVFHVAADYRLWARNPRELYDSNVEGTRNLLEAARAAGVERVVYTSTVGAIGIPRNGLGDEATPVSLADMGGDYKRSKFLAEQVALEFARDGLNVVIVNPTAPMGDHDFKPTPTGQIVLDFLNGALPAYIDTGLNVVDARDAAEGHWLACQRGRSGERYILGSENLTLAEILCQVGGHQPSPSTARTPTVFPGMVRRRVQHGLGAPFRIAAAHFPGIGAPGQEENVGHSRQGHAGTGLPAGAGGAGAGARGGMVHPRPEQA